MNEIQISLLMVRLRAELLQDAHDIFLDVQRGASVPHAIRTRAKHLQSILDIAAKADKLEKSHGN